jgi:ATP dependent DNA ligase domain
MVQHYLPMAPTLVREPFHRDGWVYEEKVDGWRILAYKDSDRVRLVSRNGRDHTRRFADLAAAVAKLSARALVLDGEAAVFDQQLRSRFDWLREPDPDAVASPPLYMAFDLLSHERRDLTGRPLRDRRARLEDVVAGSELVFPVRRLAPDGLEAWKQVVERGYEGYVAKDERSAYASHPDHRVQRSVPPARTPGALGAVLLPKLCPAGELLLEVRSLLRCAENPSLSTKRAKRIRGATRGYAERNCAERWRAGSRPALVFSFKGRWLKSRPPVTMSRIGLEDAGAADPFATDSPTAGGTGGIVRPSESIRSTLTAPRTSGRAWRCRLRSCMLPFESTAMLRTRWNCPACRPLRPKTPRMRPESRSNVQTWLFSPSTL